MDCCNLLLIELLPNGVSLHLMLYSNLEILQSNNSSLLINTLILLLNCFILLLCVDIHWVNFTLLVRDPPYLIIAGDCQGNMKLN